MAVLMFGLEVGSRKLKFMTLKFDTGKQLLILDRRCAAPSGGRGRG